MESICVDFLVFYADCFYPVALLLKLHDKGKNFILYTRINQASSISSDNVNKILNDKLSLELLLSISLVNFVFAIRFNVESRMKCGFIVQYEVSSKSIFKKYLAKNNKLLQKVS